MRTPLPHGPRFGKSLPCNPQHPGWRRIGIVLRTRSNSPCRKIHHAQRGNSPCSKIHYARRGEPMRGWTEPGGLHMLQIVIAATTSATLPGGALYMAPKGESEILIDASANHLLQPLAEQP